MPAKHTDLDLYHLKSSQHGGNLLTSAQLVRLYTGSAEIRTTSILFTSSIIEKATCLVQSCGHHFPVPVVVVKGWTAATALVLSVSQFGNY